MFGHLKAKDFVKLTEGIDQLPAKRRSHLEACARCRAAWMSLESLHTEVSSIDDEVPEPDWEEFRSSVRDRLLSRSIQREPAVETTIEAGPERALFDELVQLGDDEQQQLRQVLEASQKGPRQK